MSAVEETGSGPTIMVVDDESRVCRLFEKVLSEEGYRVVTASNGRDAMELAKETHPHIVLLDIVMPEMDGIATLRELRKHEKFSVVVMLTARGSIQTARDAMSLGAYDYITKPFDLEFLKSTLRNALAEHEQIKRKSACAC
jgi:DNA-binding NtrC family response regulator